MTTVVVGGHSRNVGKTSVAAGLIRTFRGYPWTAIKISSHWHTDSNADEICAISEESDPDGFSDSSRFLAAGAARSFWIRIREGKMKESIPRLLPILQSSPFVMIESSGILRYVQPDFYIMVVRYDVADFKESARETLDRAHAIVAVPCDFPSPAWKDLLDKKMTGIPLFATPDPGVIPAGLLDLIQSKLPSLHIGAEAPTRL
jgi:hypothetical protein